MWRFCVVKAPSDEDEDEDVKSGRGSGEGEDCRPVTNMDLYLWRLKPCVRCCLEHLGRDFPRYREDREKKNPSGFCLLC